MHDLVLLVNITIALGVALLGGVIARRVGLPTIVGYLLAGVMIGPFTPGFVGDTETISELAELGVIFLMFGVGLHFSFKDLWNVRDIAIPGAVGQMLVTTLLGLGASRLWGWPVQAGIVLGLAISIASTVVLLRGLMDNSLLNTPHGQAAVGWLVMEDLATVLILVLMPALAQSSGGFDWRVLGFTLLKAALFFVAMFFIGIRLLPWFLERIAHTRSRELFILAILTIALGIAMGSAELFGVSLALGAFVAGAVVSESPLSHQVGADLFPFREAFSVLFFVSVGMLVNPAFLVENIQSVLLITALVVVGKPLMTLLMSPILPRPGRTILVVSAGLSQIGEFSFILGQAAMSLGMMNRDQYSLILAGALLSISLNPLLFQQIDRAEHWLQRAPRIWRWVNRQGAPPALPRTEVMKDHVVIVGYGQVGSHMVDVLEALDIPRLVIEADIERVADLNQRKIATLYGDAANSDIITHACLEHARALVVTVPDDDASLLVVTAARDINPNLSIIARAATLEGVSQLSRLGARYVVHTELEGGLEMVQHTLLALGFPLREVHEYTQAVRRDQYDFMINTNEEHRLLNDLLMGFSGIDITWALLPEDSPVAGQTLAEANIRARSGASVVALVRDHQLIPNPKSITVFTPGDRVGMIGEPEQIEAALGLLGTDGRQGGGS